MAKKTALLILILSLIFLLPAIILAEDMWFYDSQYLLLDVSVSSGFELSPKGMDFSVDSVNAYLNFNPQETDRILLQNKTTQPTSSAVNNSLKFYWQEPAIGSYDFSMDSTVKVLDKQTQVKSKVKFPVEALPKEIIPYTLPTDMIDINSDILNQANKLAEGEDDLYVVAFKIGTWVNKNINYNLSSVTASVTQKSSWVMANRQGVCDELTSLYISMLRSVGIPARYVAGIAYTNSDLFDERWGPHGWAEVYFPGYGWVPFDATYGEFGHIDPSHIDLQKSVTSNDPSTTFSWRARNVELKTQPIDYNVNILEVGPKAQDEVSIESEIYRETVKFGSYNYIKTIITNANDYYVPVGLMISRSENIQNSDDEVKYFLLKPKQSQNVFWKFKVNSGLDKDFIYTFKIMIATLKNQTNILTFKSEPTGVSFDSDEIDSLINAETVNTQNFNSSADLTCITSSSKVYTGENIDIRCRIINSGNTMLSNLKLCYNTCQAFDLGIGQEKEQNITATFDSTGMQKVLITLINNQVSKTNVIDLETIDFPKISIKNVEAPTEVEYNSEYSVNFDLIKESLSNPKNVRIRFTSNDLSKEWFVADMGKNQKFTLNLRGKDLRQKKGNVLLIDVSYEDSEGVKKELSNEQKIDLNNMPWYAGIMGFFYTTFGDNAPLVMMGSAAAAIIILVFVITFASKAFVKKQSEK